jgi:hypothetical protein
MKQRFHCYVNAPLAEGEQAALKRTLGLFSGFVLYHVKAPLLLPAELQCVSLGVFYARKTDTNAPL